MVSIGDEGFYGADDTGSAPCPPGGPPSGKQWWCNGSAGDWIGLRKTPDIDFACIHMYPDILGMQHWGIGSEDDVAVGWVTNHTREAHALGKPLLMGEVGNGAAGLEQHEKYAIYTQAAADAGTGGWAVWMFAALNDQYYSPPDWPSWWRSGDANLQVYCLRAGDPSPPNDGGSHDPDSCATLASAAAAADR